MEIGTMEVFFIGLGIVLIMFIGIIPSFRRRHIDKNGIRTQAEIVEFVQASPGYRVFDDVPIYGDIQKFKNNIPIYGDLRKLKHPPSYTVRIRFQDFLGRTIETEYYSRGKYLSRLRNGAKIPIIYLPANPCKCYAPQDQGTVGHAVWACIGAIIGMIWIIFKI